MYGHENYSILALWSSINDPFTLLTGHYSLHSAIIAFIQALWLAINSTSSPLSTQYLKPF